MPPIVPPDPPQTSSAVPIKSYSWGLSAETNAELKIIGELSPDDLEFLRDYVDITIRALNRNINKHVDFGSAIPAVSKPETEPLYPETPEPVEASPSNDEDFPF